MRLKKVTVGDEMAETLIRYDQWDVDQRLHELGGLTRSDLIEAVKAAVSAVNDCTDNDPPAARGWEGWRAATRRLREIHRTFGWVKDDTSNFSTIINHKASIKLAVANTDEFTGNAQVHPTNRSRKGANADRASKINQATLPFVEWQSETEPQTAVIPGYATWYLCLYVEGDRVRAELSLPTRMENGFFAEWSERVILVSSDDDWHGSKLPSFDDDEGPEFEVIVQRK